MNWFKAFGVAAASFVLVLCLVPTIVCAQSLIIDAAVSKDRSTPNPTTTTPAFSTVSPKELLLAFVSSDAPQSGPNTTVIGISGGGLTWQLVQRTNTQLGTAEIWRAFALSTLSNVSATVTLSQSVASSVTLVSFIGADPSGINGSGAIGATGSANSSNGAPSASLVTTRNNSWVFGVGNDWDTAVSRTLGSGQTMIHQYLATVHDTYWVQSETNPTPASGTTVVINDAAPITDRYNMSLVEVLPMRSSPPTGPLSIDTQVSSDKSTASTTNSTPAFSTTSPNELLLAFVSSDSKTNPNTTITSISGGGIAFQLVQRTNVQLGTAEIWRAFATTQLANVSFTVTLSQSVASSVTVLSLIGADPSGTNGSGAIGALGTGNSGGAAPTASLTTTRNYSWVFGVGNDWNNAISRTTGINQSLVHQYVASVNDTYWVQAQNSPTTQSGTPVTMDDTAPTGDSYNLSIVEVLPAITGTPLQVTASATPPPNANGWNVSQVTVTFQCTGGVSPVQCPAQQIINTEGANQVVTGTATDNSGNGVAASVTLNIDETPPIITSSITPGPNSAGWNNSPVTVVFTCSDSLSGIATCPASTQVSSEGMNQQISGTATDRAGNSVSSTASINLDMTPPAVSVTSPLEGATVNVSTLQLIGSITDNLSSVAAFTCDGVSASISAGAFTCDLTLTSGLNDIQLQASDVAGNTATESLSVTYGIGLNPPPSGVYITPDSMALASAEPRQLSLVDDLARVIPATSWNSSDPTIVSAAMDGRITAVNAGTAVITGTYQGLSAQAEVTVYNEPFLAPGTVRWSVQPLSGNQVLQVNAGRPSDASDPDLYVFEQGSSGLILRAFSSDGQQKWIHSLITSLGSPSTAAATALQTNMKTRQIGAGPSRSVRIQRPHRWGKKITAVLNRHQTTGMQEPDAAIASDTASTQIASSSSGALVTQQILSTASTDSNNRVINLFERLNVYPGTDRDNIIVLDSSGNELWRWSIDGGEMGYALHPDGIVYILQADYINNSVFTLFGKDEITGQDRFSPIQLPMSLGGALQPFPGLPSVLPDGNLYLPVEHQDDYSEDKLDLLKVSPDGTYSWLPLLTGGFCNIFGEFSNTHEIVPYGLDKFLVTWDHALFNQCESNRMARVATFTTQGQFLNQYQIPLSRMRSYFSDNDGDLAIGDNDTGFIAGTVFAPGGLVTTPVLGFNLASGVLDGQDYTPPSPTGLNFELDANDNLVVLDPVDNSVSHVDPTGAITPDSWTALVPPGEQGFVYDLNDPVQAYYSQFPPDFVIEQFYSFFPNILGLPASTATSALSSTISFGQPSGAAAVLGNALAPLDGLWFQQSMASTRERNVHIHFQQTAACSGFDDVSQTTVDPNNPKHRIKQSWIAVGLSSTQGPGQNNVILNSNVDFEALDFIPSDPSIMITRGAVKKDQMTLTISASIAGNTTHVDVVNHENHNMTPYATLFVDVQPYVSRNVYPFVTSQQNPPQQPNGPLPPISLVPQNAENASGALQTLLESIFGVQANVHFVVSGQKSVAANYDLNHDGKLNVPLEGARTIGTPEMVAVQQGIASSGCTCAPDTHGIFPAYVKAFDKPYTGITPVGFSPYIEDSHSDTTELLTSHEIGHTLGLGDICPGDVNDPTVQACLNSSGKEKDRIMWHLDGDAGKCRVNKTEWDQIHSITKP
jgi:hypothetical protein